jgi:hypothetical protein
MTTGTLRIVGRELPGRDWSGHRNVHVGVQRRRDVVDQAPADAEGADFDITLDVASDDYRGPFAQGRRGQRFVYLSWGEVDDEGCFTMFRRAKLRLDVLPDDVASALRAGHTVEAALGLTGADGGPLCAAIPPHQISWRVLGA